MCEKNSVNKDETMINVVRKYMNFISGNTGKHKANILVHVNGRDLCANVLPVLVVLSENSIEVIIENFDTIYGDCGNRFTLQNSSFSLQYKTLCIESKDVFGNIISISITKA